MFAGPGFMLIAFGSILAESDYKNNWKNEKNTKIDEIVLPPTRNLRSWTNLTRNYKDDDEATEVYWKNVSGEYNFLTNDFTTIPATSRTLKPTNTKDHKCPEGFSYYRHFLGFPFCYILTEKQTFPPKCPYENYLEHDTIRNIYKEFENQSIWIRAVRNNEDGFGEFVWLDPSTRYLQLVDSYERPTDKIMERNCMITYQEKYIPVLCDEKYQALCVYSYSYKVIGKYCTRSNTNTDSNCISTSLNLDNQCYCQAYSDGLKLSRNDFCTKLAEPTDPFQNNMLLTELTNKSPCWFGLQHNGDGNFHWTSTNQSTNYTYWKSNVDESKLYGALDYSKPAGWTLEDEWALTCAICETEFEYLNVTIHLQFMPNLNIIAARIQNFFEIHNYFIQQYMLACFTDANDDGMVAKILSALSDLFPKKQNYTKLLDVDNDYPSYYWCETLQRPNLTKVYSNKILAYKNTGRHGNEYSLLITVPVAKETDPYIDELHLQATKFLKDELEKTTKIINMVRPMKVLELSQVDQHMFLLLHLSSIKTDLSSEDEYQLFLDALQNIPKTTSVIKSIIKLSHSMVCLPNTTVSGNMTLHWPETNIGATVLPKELCLQPDSSPVTRKCEGDFLYGSEWGDVIGDCHSEITYSERTLTLYDLLNSEQNSSELGRNLCDATNNTDDVLVIDVHLVAEILEKLEKYDDVNITQVANTFSNIMEFNGDVLRESQAQLNSTDRALYILDQISSKVKISAQEGYLSVSSKTFLIQISDLKRSNVTGVAVKKTKDTFFTIPLYKNTSLEALLQLDVDVAVFLPTPHLKEITDCMGEQSEIKIIFSMFHDDALFNEITESFKTGNSRIISVLIPGAICAFETPIPLTFKLLNHTNSSDCAHWSYGNNDKQESTYGIWKIDSEPEITTDSYAICAYSHTTHFALLMFSQNREDEIGPEDVLALNIITAIGCALSLFGIGAIFITAIAFKSWRNRSRNIIMLNFSASLAAQMILLFVADNAREHTIACVISGASLHYTVLAEFAWMLIVAILQYRKFVLVFQKPIRHLLLKCLIVGWFLPLVPVVILFAAFPDSYEQNSAGVCYPANKQFLYGVAVPIGAIILINLFVFVKILLNICHKKVESYGPKHNDTKLQVLLAILLFFLLGMSWLFGLASAFVDWLILSYLFCLTATLQGFVIFIFFVVMNKKSRLLWLNIKKFCYCSDARKRIY